MTNAHRKAQTIRNVAKLDENQLRAQLIKHGVNVPEDANWYSMVGLAKDNGLWDYKGDVVDPTYKARYGSKQRCGDELSEAVHANTRNSNGGVDLEALRVIQSDNNIDGNRWSHCNAGQQVMNTSNVLRGKVKRGEYVLIGAEEFNSAAKPVNR